MKYLLLATLALASSAYAGGFKCQKKVDKSHVVVFIDTRNSEMEVADARIAACNRGEDFLRIPETGYLNQVGLKSELTRLANKNIAVSSLVVSGHDGGGTVHGDSGSLDKYEIISSFKEVYKDKPKLLKEFKSVFMWGCWTMGPSEVDVWRKELPSLKMASGFFDMGPLNTAQASHTVLRSLLEKEKIIEHETDQKHMKRTIASITDINQTYASVYAEALCGDMYYYRTQGGGEHNGPPTADDANFTAGEHFVNYAKSFSCEDAAPDIERNRQKLMKYFNGTLPLPKDGPNSEVQHIYAFIRSHAKCFKADHVMNGDRIGLLRFYDNVKSNFSDVFSGLIADASKDFLSLEGFTRTYKAKGKPMQEFEKYLQDGKSAFFIPNNENLQKKSRKDINKMISYLDGLTKLDMARDPKFAVNVKRIKSLKNTMDAYLYQLSPQCMDFLEWHEPAVGWSPKAKCNY